MKINLIIAFLLLIRNSSFSMTPPHRCPTDIIETTEAEIDIIDKQYRKNLLDEARKRSLVKRDKFKQKAHRAQTRKDILKELQKRPLAAAERLEKEEIFIKKKLSWYVDNF